MNYIEQIKDIISKNNGIILTSDLAKAKIPRTYLSKLQDNCTIERISRGIYIFGEVLEDEMFCLQAKHKRTIFSHETALFIHDLTDKIPYTYTVTVPSGYNAGTLKENGLTVFFVKSELYEMGVCEKKSPHGNTIKVFNRERTICDILRSRKKIDIQILNQAIKEYIKEKSANLKLLYDYASRFKIQNIVRQYIEFLL
jgi:predicted transcriptional regulator of viral defense system